MLQIFYGTIYTNYNNGISNSWNSQSPYLGWSQEDRKYQDQPEFARYNQVRTNTQGVGIKVFFVLYRTNSISAVLTKNFEAETQEKFVYLYL